MLAGGRPEFVSPGDEPQSSDPVEVQCRHSPPASALRFSITIDRRPTATPSIERCEHWHRLVGILHGCLRHGGLTTRRSPGAPDGTSCLASTAPGMSRADRR